MSRHEHGAPEQDSGQAGPSCEKPFSSQGASSAEHSAAEAQQIQHDPIHTLLACGSQDSRAQSGTGATNPFQALAETASYQTEPQQAKPSESRSVKPPPRLVTQDLPSHIRIPSVSWNIGGTSVANAVQSIRRSAGAKIQIVCLQEMPRRECGWHTEVLEDLTLVQYRHDDDQWRGNAIGFGPQFQVIRKRGCRFGVWLRLRHLPTGNEVWIGSHRLSTGVNSDTTADELRVMCKLLPPTLLPVVLLGDFNTKLRWTDALDPQGDLRPTEARSEYVLSELGNVGLQMRAPTKAQWDTPTSRPRRTKVQGHQIDGCAYKNCRMSSLSIEVDSYKQIGGDHERVSCDFPLRTGESPPPLRAVTRPRFVTTKLPSLHRVDQKVLQDLAKKCTAPRPGLRYRDPPDVKDLYAKAKQTGSENDWKTAHKARRKAQEEWRHARNERAADGHWQSYRSLKNSAGNEWTVHFVEAAEEAKQEPKRWTVQHFRTLFQKTELRDPPRWDKDIDTGRHFTIEDLRLALQKGKTNKAVGEDLVSFELIQALCEDSSTEESLLNWMERLRCGEALPREWLRTIVTLLPKNDKPRGPKDLRPISVGASAAKVFGTMLLMRTRRYIRPAGASQCAHNGRQTADYLYAAIKSFSLDTEWHLGLSWCRIDIQKAFDTLARDKTLQLLRDNLPPEMFLEYRCWERLFYEGTALLKTPWGDEEIPQGRGIRQGSVESPFLFSIAIEMALKTATEHAEWPSTIPSIPDLPLAELLYMDDTLLWAASRDDMVKKYNILKTELAKWGLRVNPEKTSYYHSPYSTTPGNITLDGQIIQPAANMTVFGIPLLTPLKPSALMDTAMSKASKKFYGNKHIFMSRAPLKGKLKTFRTLVGGSALWYCSAISPSNQALSSMNTLQLELLAKTIGFRRKSDETWLDFRTRSMRGARHVLHSHHMERWSTTWLKRFWDYKGHVARASDRQFPPASSLMDSVRTLEWWTEKQRAGVRHPGQFFPYHTNEEKALNRAAGGMAWRQVARDVTTWAQCKNAWVHSMDIAWASGRQLAIGT